MMNSFLVCIGQYYQDVNNISVKHNISLLDNESEKWHRIVHAKHFQSGQCILKYLGLVQIILLFNDEVFSC